MSAAAANYTDYTLQALAQTRDPQTLGWSIVVLIGLVSYLYTVEIQARRWPVVFAGLGFLLMDLFNETINGIVLHASGYSAIWTVTGPTVYQPLVGLNAEILFTFAIAGMGFAKVLPEDRDARILGINNRLFLVTVFSMLSVAIEVALHFGGIFHWGYPWWGWPAVPLIVLVGYMPFYGMAAWLYDLGEQRGKQLRLLALVGGTDLALIVVFGPVLGWL